ncbi:22990_t:CDS:2 [Cetraspora pellucida]|uniref:22990_t:CDS:1 n=1 Tax=Cetraspora pellucida TaxID=1433469 RepID=A0A9N9HFB1_9GLOM|nr:22990_t:CDS:2 [Cetraspora pellucida]
MIKLIALNQLERYKKDLTEEELQACANITTIPIDLSLQDIFNTNNIFNDNEPYITNQNIPTSVFTPVNSDTFITSETKLNVEDIANLALSFFFLILITWYRIIKILNYNREQHQA